MVFQVFQIHVVEPSLSDHPWTVRVTLRQQSTRQVIHQLKVEIPGAPLGFGTDNLALSIHDLGVDAPKGLRPQSRLQPKNTRQGRSPHHRRKQHVLAVGAGVVLGAYLTKLLPDGRTGLGLTTKPQMFRQVSALPQARWIPFRASVGNHHDRGGGRARHLDQIDLKPRRSAK
jgi:hypothetical protein